jgi:FkbM family methyltransferase
MFAIVNIARFIAGHPLTRDHKLGAFARFIRWQLESRLLAEVTVPWIEGTRLLVRRGMTGATGNIYCGLHEFEDMAFLLHFLRPGDVFLDIGANIGSYTILASGVKGARTFAFEPDPVTFVALWRNVTLNGLGSIVTVRECALGPGQGRIKFTRDLDTENRVATAEDSASRLVALDSVDHALEGVVPTLIKLDVEGFESEILSCAEATLGAPGLKAILTEDRSPGVSKVLQSAGFVEQSYDPFERKLVSGRRHSPGGNALFVRDLRFVRERLADAPLVRVLERWL